MKCEGKELECLFKIKDIDASIPEFGEVGVLDPDIGACLGCAYFMSLGFGNSKSNNYCSNSETIELYREIKNKPCRHISLDNLFDPDKSKIRLLLNKMALEQTRGEEYRETKQEFLELASELCRAGIKHELIKDLIHTYNNIRLIKELAIS